MQGTVGHALTKMLKEGHMGMKDIKVGGSLGDTATLDATCTT
jgi:hypothetical protein